jgi:hypothetical protein
MKITFNAEAAEIAEQDPLRNSLRAPRALRSFSEQHIEYTEPDRLFFSVISAISVASVAIPI